MTSDFDYDKAILELHIAHAEGTRRLRRRRYFQCGLVAIGLILWIWLLQ